jgi:hypothetical protein
VWGYGAQPFPTKIATAPQGVVKVECSPFASYYITSKYSSTISITIEKDDDERNVFVHGRPEAGLSFCNDTNTSSMRITLKEKVIDFQPGWSQGLILTATGKIYVYGTIANHTDSINGPKLRELHFPSRVVGIFDSDHHGIIRTEDDRWYGWGFNGSFALGMGDNRHREEPDEIVFLRGKGMTKCVTSPELTYVYGNGHSLAKLTTMIGDKRFSDVVVISKK